jgi:hypothetical protein
MGSIAEVWNWLVHLPFLGWALAAVLVACLWALVSFLRFAIRNG